MKLYAPKYGLLNNYRHYEGLRLQSSVYEQIIIQQTLIIIYIQVVCIYGIS